MVVVYRGWNAGLCDRGMMGNIWQDVLHSILIAQRLQSTEANLRLGTGADG
jgi:hypothetical protein